MMDDEDDGDVRPATEADWIAWVNEETMTDDHALAELKMFARAGMKTMRDKIEAGGEVPPVAFLLLPNDHVVVVPVNTPSSAHRAAILRVAVETTQARALLLVTDAWTKDRDNPTIRTGELLSAILVTRDQPENGVGFMQQYRRNPFIWEPVIEADHVNFAYEVFPSTHH